MSVCFFKSLPNGKNSNVFVVEALLSKYLSGKTSLSVKNSYLPTFLYDEAKMLAFVCLNCIELSFT